MSELTSYETYILQGLRPTLEIHPDTNKLRISDVGHISETIQSLVNVGYIEVISEEIEAGYIQLTESGIAYLDSLNNTPVEPAAE